MSFFSNPQNYSNRSINGTGPAWDDFPRRAVANSGHLH